MEALIKNPSNGELGTELEGPRSSEPSFKAPNIGYGVMRVTNIMTKEVLGYLGTAYNQYADIVADVKDAARLKWRSDGSDIYLEKETEPNDRYLGVGAQSYACYGLWTPTGWVDAVIHNSDKSISLKSDPKRKLYKYGNDYVCWSGGEDNQNILAFEMQNI